MAADLNKVTIAVGEGWQRPVALVHLCVHCDALELDLYRRQVDPSPAEDILKACLGMQMARMLNSRFADELWPSRAQTDGLSWLAFQLCCDK